MGLFSGGGFFGSGGKANSGNSKQRNFTLGNTQDFAGSSGVNSSVTPVTIDIGDKNKNTHVNTTIVDGGAISGAFDAVDGAFGLIKDVLTGQSTMFEEFTSSTNATTFAALDAVGTANDGANALSELAIMEMGENSDTFMSLAGDMVESNANLGQTYGDNLAYLTDTTLSSFAAQSSDNANNLSYLTDSTLSSFAAQSSDNANDLSYLTDSTIANNFALSESVMNNNSLLIDGFADRLDASSMRESQTLNTAMNNNASLISQFGADLTGMSSQFNNNLTSLSSQYGADLAGMNSQFNNNLTDLTGQTQSALLEMAKLQEVGLDNALQVAGSMATDDNSEASTNMVKYVMLGVGAVAVAMVIKNE